MRVLLVAASLDIIGGQSVQAASVARHLSDEPSVEVSFLPINPRLPGPLRRLQDIKYVRTIVTSIAYVARLLAQVPRSDVVLAASAAHSSFVLAPTPAILIARAFGKRVVLHYHAGEADSHLRAWRRTAGRTMRLADAIVVPSRYLAEQFARHGLGARVIVNVIDPDDFPFRERRPLRPVVLFNRQLSPITDGACVLRAFAQVQREVDDATLIVAGDGIQRPELERQARRLGLRNTRFLGWVPPEGMAALYDSADLFLHASNERDNVPVSILEAFAAGLPVVATESAGVPELVRSGETGLLTPEGDDAALAAGALRLIRSPDEAAEMASNARAECSRFTWPAVRDQWLALYSELSGSSRSASSR